ncbi:MAG: hypothetical protein LBC51_11265 [Treponema sp.]|jgi:hypothetical protein|nr:hypothetical protein [Treponema sp.]
MARANKEVVAGIVRNTLITQYGYQIEGDYVRKPITENYGIGFFHNAQNTLCICVHHREGSEFSPTQKEVIGDVLSRPEFTNSYHPAKNGESTDGKYEIRAPLKITGFYAEAWTDEEVAEWICKLFEHFICTVELLQLN